MKSLNSIFKLEQYFDLKLLKQTIYLLLIYLIFILIDYTSVFLLATYLSELIQNDAQKTKFSFLIEFFNDKNDFLFSFSVLIFVFFVIRFFISLFANYQDKKFCEIQSAAIAKKTIKLFSIDSIFKLNNFTHEQKIVIVDYDIPRSVYYLKNLCLFCREILLVLGIGGTLLFINPVGFVVLSGVFLPVWFIKVFFIGRKVKILGEGARTLKQNQIIDLFKVIHLSDLLAIYQNFESTLKSVCAAMSGYEDYEGQRRLLVGFPRFLLEMLFVGAIALVVVFSLADEGPQLSKLFVDLSFFAVGGLRLITAATSLTTVIGELGYQQASFKKIEAIGTLGEQFPSKYWEAIEPQAIVHSLKSLKWDGTLVLKDVSFKYPGGTAVLDGVNIDLPLRGFVCVKGPSGSGKTTLMLLLLGMLRPDSGRVTLNDKSISDGCDWNQMISYCPQFSFFFPGTVSENIVFDGSEPIVERLDHVAKQCGLRSFISDLDMQLDPSSLSGGQIQRLNVARALYKDARVYLLDEPTSALDTDNEAIIINCLQNYRRENLVIAISHNKALTRAADFILEVRKGKISWFQNS